MGATCGHCALPVSRGAQCSRPDCPLRKPPEARVPRFENAGPAASSLPELVSCAEPKAPESMFESLLRSEGLCPEDLLNGHDQDPRSMTVVSCAEPKAPAPLGGMIGVQYRPAPGQQPWAIVTNVRGTLVTQERHPTQEAAEAAVPEVRRALRSAFSL